MKSTESIKQELSPVKTEMQYRYYLSVIDDLIDCEENSQEEELLELVSLLVEDYESKHYPIEAPDPVEAVKHKALELGLKRKDLAPYFGSISRVSEVLNRKRPMSLEMARKIHKGLGISAETLLS